ncbi:MAG: AAA family ATPase [Chitinispirillaceae bacterium]|nr:AAA family ATPase [Chitinispirillaceae bacterium]
MRGTKIAISGKGGVGKSTVAAVWARLLAAGNRPVYAIDADPDANLAHALGIPEGLASTIKPLASNDRLIEERTGAQRGKPGQIFSLLPEVSDIAKQYACEYRGVHALVLGAIKKGGAGCACPESALLRSLVRHLILHESEIVILDMEAGVEHLGRATAAGVDALVIVVEPGSRSIETARHIARLAADIDLGRRLFLLINKARETDRTAAAAQAALPDVRLLGAIPFDNAFIAADEQRTCVIDLPGFEQGRALFQQPLDALIRMVDAQHTPERTA